MEGIEYIKREELAELVRGIVATQLTQQVEEFVRRNEERAKAFSVLERIVRVEEELKSLREIELARFEAITKRFEASEVRFESLHREMNKHFEVVDTRLEALHRETDKRFETVDSRFEALHREMDKRFEAVDARLDALHREMDKRFDLLDKRFEGIEKRFSFMQWFMLTGFSVVSLLVAIIGLYKG